LKALFSILKAGLKGGLERLAKKAQAPIFVSRKTRSGHDIWPEELISSGLFLFGRAIRPGALQGTRSGKQDLRKGA
jgi:hypothetical protein